MFSSKPSFVAREDDEIEFVCEVISIAKPSSSFDPVPLARSAVPGKIPARRAVKRHRPYSTLARKEAKPAKDDPEILLIDVETFIPPAPLRTLTQDEIWDEFWSQQLINPLAPPPAPPAPIAEIDAAVLDYLYSNLIPINVEPCCTRVAVEKPKDLPRLASQRYQPYSIARKGVNKLANNDAHISEFICRKATRPTKFVIDRVT